MRSLWLLTRLLLLIVLLPIMVVWHGTKEWWRIFSEEGYIA